jgi:predicted lipoprotein with Yx(FWY)xxD motif
MLGIPNRGLVMGAIFIATGLVAGCGGSSSSAPPTTSTNPSAKPGTKFGTAAVSGVGTVLVDARGRTVYILTSAAKKNVPCSDASGCTDVWPDLSLPDGTSSASAGSGVDSALLGTSLANGETYPTYNGYLLYEYTGDSGSGEANGQGLKSFGGTWYALSASGKPVKTSDSGGGYGYP